MHYKTPEIFLDTIRKMTPGCSGVWKNLKAVTNPYEADFVFIIDGYSGPFPEERAIYLGEHPPCSGLYSTWETKKALLRFPLNKYLNPGEWWISHDYDTLSNLKPPAKTKNTVCVMTYQTHNAMYSQRPKFMGELLKQFKDIDLYGRPSEKFIADPLLNSNYKGALGKDKPNGLLGEHLIGKEEIINYRYSLEFDVGPTINYMSERFYDSLLLWCMPIYFGSSNLGNFLPSNSFVYIDIHNLNDTKKVINSVMGDLRESNIDRIAEARNLLLNRYQLWAYVDDIINNLDRYKKEQGGI
jgi:hypothetical protein